MKNGENDKHMLHVLKLQLGHRSPRTTLPYARDPLHEHIKENLERFKLNKKSDIKKDTEEYPEERS